MARILLVDDDQNFASSVEVLLGAESHDIATAPSVEEANRLLGTEVFDLMFVDLSLPDGSGLDLIREEGPKSVIITGHPSIETAIRALRGPVVDYLVKPLDKDQLMRSIETVMGARQLEKTASSQAQFHDMVGACAVMNDVFENIREFGPTDLTVLITGESGTGKDLVAQALHKERDARRKFVAINCGAIARELVASELFGHEKGSFTGAVGQRKGLFERAGSGTVFLDEISELSLDQQVNLLRVVENRTIVRVGGEEELPIEARIVAATNQDLAQAVEDGKFREDLYFRLMVLPIHVPPLRERAGDVAPLAEHFLAQFAEAHEAPTELSAEALAELERYTWPGNVRELKHALLRAAILNRGQARIERLPENFDRPPCWKDNGGGTQPGTSIRDMEKALIEKTLEHFDGNKTQTAEALGISLKTLYNRLSEYEREQEQPED